MRTNWLKLASLALKTLTLQFAFFACSLFSRVIPLIPGRINFNQNSENKNCYEFMCEFCFKLVLRGFSFLFLMMVLFVVFFSFPIYNFLEFIGHKLFCIHCLNAMQHVCNRHGQLNITG